MENVKEFVIKHEREFKVGLAIIGTVTGVAVLKKAFKSKKNDNRTWVDMTGLDWIAWKSGGEGYVTFEGVKEVLELNKDNMLGSYAIVKDKVGRYICIKFNDLVIFPEKQ